MKNISRLLVILLSASFILSSCEDEDVQRFPDFVTPVVLLADNTSATIVISDVGTPAEATLDFTLDAENFDGASDGHKFFVGRSGATSTLIDVTFIANYSGAAGSASGDLFTLQASELPSSQSITLTQLSNAVGIPVGDMNGGDVIVISYTYRIDADNSGDIRELGTPSADYCGGFTDEGEFCNMRVEIVCALQTEVIDPFPGDYTLEMSDSFGDGWNGATLEVDLDGVVTPYFIADGGSASANVTVSAGTGSMTISFTSRGYGVSTAIRRAEKASNAANAPVIGVVQSASGRALRIFSKTPSSPIAIEAEVQP